MHWSNPPHLIPVIEVIRGEQTSDETAQKTVGIVEKIGMVPAMVDRDVAGFVENRILYAIMREALHLLDEGVASAEAIDTITKWGIGYKLAVIGPLELLDMAGLDIYTSVASYLNKSLNASPDVSKTVTDKVAAGKTGNQDTGRAFRIHAGANPATPATAGPETRCHAKGSRRRVDHPQLRTNASRWLPLWR
jgi:3-hydroxybutyryl-CoA dehydrogenase/5-formyl-3-hydroxy-2-methylpyridine 4-carboxylate dehydrogenase